MRSRYIFLTPIHYAIPNIEFIHGESATKEEKLTYFLIIISDNKSTYSIVSNQFGLNLR